MKRKFIISFSIIFLIIFSITVLAASVKWYSLNKAFELSEKNDKPVLVFFYTQTCPYCKKMLSITLRDKRVVEILNSQFYAVKLDANSSKKIIKDKPYSSPNEMFFYYGFRGVPVTLFFDSKGKTLTYITGYIKPEDYIVILKYIYTKAYKTQSFQEFYEKNKEK